MRSFWFIAVLAVPGIVGAAPEAPVPTEPALQVPAPGRFKALFQPLQTERAALSPDGKYLAYTLRKDGVISVAVVEIDHPEKMTACVKAISDEAATPGMSDQHEKTPARIDWMRWVSADRIVLETNLRVIHGPRPIPPGAFFTFDAQGKEGRLLATPEDFWESSEGRSAQARHPLPRVSHIFDLDPDRPGAVRIVATGRPMSRGHSVGFFSLDAATGKSTSLNENIIPNILVSLQDRQGRSRLLRPDARTTDFPYQYNYQEAHRGARPRPLSQRTGVPGFTLSPDNFFGERAIPLGFAENPDLLYYASNVGRDTYGIYSFDLAKNQPGSLALEEAGHDLIDFPGPSFSASDDLVFDRYSRELAGVRYTRTTHTARWLQPDLQAVQTSLEALYPGHSVEILEWDEHRRRFLFSIQGPADAGAFCIFDADRKHVAEFVRRSAEIDAQHTHATSAFSFPTRDGSFLTGLITEPKQPRLKPIPMIVLCPEEPWQQAIPGFQPEVQALAEMGFVVVELNSRSAWGQGVKRRQSAASGYDLAQVEDLREAVALLGKQYNVNLRRVALLGRGHGGFIALRAVQDHPELFRCAVAIDAPVNLSEWLEQRLWGDGDVRGQFTQAWWGDAARLKAAPLTTHPEALTKPVLLLNYPGPEGGTRLLPYISARNFVRAVNSHGGAAELAELSTDYTRGLPDARAAAFDQIEAFLNTHVYDFKVKLDDLKVIK